jgi:uncharacterized membrane protein YedE/YeeE
MNSSVSSEPVPSPLRPQSLVVAIALALFALGTILLIPYGWRQSGLFLIGGLLGMTLYHSSFGFASAYRRLIVYGDSRGFIAQLVMVAIATVLFAPVLANGVVLGEEVRGSVSPVGVQGALGAFLFGIGMQLGGACGCGTLYTVGSGSLTFLVTGLTFCIGAFGASLTRQLWSGLPAFPAIALGSSLGWFWAVLLQLVAISILIWSLQRLKPAEARASILTIAGFPTTLNHFIRGPWSLLTGAIALAVLNWLPRKH